MFVPAVREIGATIPTRYTTIGPERNSDFGSAEETESDSEFRRLAREIQIDGWRSVSRCRCQTDPRLVVGISRA